MLKAINSIFHLCKKRITYFHEVDNKNWYFWSKTYIEWIQNEIDEVKKEVENPERFMYLEDELWDIFWVYMCLLESLEQEWKIKKSRVFDRCLHKFRERIGENADKWEQWQEIKAQQKQALLCEYQSFCKKDTNKNEKT